MKVDHLTLSETWKKFCTDKNIFILKKTLVICVVIECMAMEKIFTSSFIHSCWGKWKNLLAIVCHCVYLVPTSWSSHMWTISILQAKTPPIILYLVADLLWWWLWEIAVLFEFSTFADYIMKIRWCCFFSKWEVTILWSLLIHRFVAGFFFFFYKPLL